jgi:hypothetical protein
MLLRNRFLGGLSSFALMAPEGAVGGDAAPAGGSVAPVNIPTDSGPISLRDAARSLGSRREKGNAAAEPEAQPGDRPTEQPRVNGRFASAAAPDESAPDTGEDAAADVNQPPGEAEQGDDPAEQPSIDPPRSWTKEEKEAFKLLPPEYQQTVAERERKREADIRRGQDEVANQTKALTAKEQAAEQARQQYEAAAQNALHILQQQQAAEFGDIRTQADVERLATDDPFRFAQWQARQMRIHAQAQEVEHLNQQRQEKEQKTFETWSKEQDDKFSGQFKEFNDPEAGPKARQSVQSYLTKEVGVPEDVLPKLWNNPLFRDAMFQRVIYDASRFHAAQQKAKAAVPVKVPPVQRPGAAPAKGEQGQADIKALETKLSKATTVRDQIAAAAALRAAKRVATR